jgi:dihydropyrimidinase
VSDLDVVFRNGTIVTAIDSYKADLGVKDGVIVAIGAISSPGAQEIDCSGMLVMPGGVDSHVHLDQPLPQGEMCDDFASGTASAAAGGTTATLFPASWPTTGKKPRAAHVSTMGST